MYPSKSTSRQLSPTTKQPALPASAAAKPQPDSPSVERNNPKISAHKRRPPTSQERVSKLPQALPAPPWLKLLFSLQHKSKILFLTIFGLSLVSYAYTVHIQDRWKQQHRQLTRLREQEREQIVVNEGLKHQMAQAAQQPQSGLVNPHPSKIVFVTAAPPRGTKSIAHKNTNPPIIPPPPTQAIGY